MSTLHHSGDAVGTSRVDKKSEFIEMTFRLEFISCRKRHTNQHDPLTERAVNEPRIFTSERAKAAAVIADNRRGWFRHPEAQEWRCVAKVLSGSVPHRGLLRR